MNTSDSITYHHEEFNRKVQAACCTFRLLFNRHQCSIENVPEVLKSYTSGTHYLSTKQVASATLLRKAGSASVAERIELLRTEGFKLRPYEHEPSKRNVLTDTSSGGVESDFVSGFNTASEYQDQTTAEVSLGTPAPENTKRPRPQRPGLSYEDPWLTMSGRVFAYSAKEKPSMPHTIVWAGDGLRLQDPLPRRLLGPKWTGKARNQVRFHEIATLDCKLHVVYNHTHWGVKLREIIGKEKRLRADGLTSSDRRIRWARTLSHRITDFLRGRPDPLWNMATTRSLWSDTRPRDPKARAVRLYEVLKTIDGMFQQRYFAYPEEQWTWEKFDMFTLSNLSSLLADEFLDGSLTEVGLSRKTRYSELKKLRKTFKEHALRGELDSWLNGGESEIHPDFPVWLRQYLPVYRQVSKEKGQRYIYLVGLLSQTRGCGTPPPLVVLQSKEKFLKTVSVQPELYNATQRRLCVNAVSSVLNKIPGEAFTGLATKSRITVTTSACWDRTRREGGTLGHIHDIVEDGRNNVQARVIDLDTNKLIELKRLDEFDSPGEYIFWRCLDLVLRTNPVELRNAYLTVVKEPGKGRSVTKARSYLKVVLDLVGKLCSEPLKKGVPSSTSGMGQSHHGWNFFNLLFSQEVREDLFAIEKEETTTYATYVEHERVYHDLFVSSTDYEEATDSMLHEFAAIASEGWMRKCGIPPLLRGIVHETCYRPRKIFFQGSGAFEKYGEPAPEYGVDVRQITLLRGVLMGDPITKIVLHIANICTREIAEGLTQALWLSPGFTNPNQMVLG